MSYDYDGIADDPRSGQQPENEGTPHGVAESHEESLSPTEGDICLEGQAVPEELLENGIPREVVQSIEVLSEYEGILPIAKQFNEYNEKGQDAIIQIALMQTKAIFQDESARQDKLIQAEIKQGYVGLITSSVICALAIIAAMVAAICTENGGIVAAIIGFPFAGIIGKLFIPIGSRSRKPKNDKA